MRGMTSTATNSAIPAGLRKRAYDAAILKDATKHAAGILVVADDGDILLLKRAGVEGQDNFVGHWALPGGGVEDGETPEQGALREAREEIGLDVAPESLIDLDKVRTETGMGFHTFGVHAKQKIQPKLNDEHLGYGWFSPDALPTPMHPAVEAMLKKEIAAEDVEGPIGDSALSMALDRDSVREKDVDGRLRVAKSNISKANVCPYRGGEIPGWRALGLDENRVYNLLRDPEELRKAAKSLNGVPLLIKHTPVSAADHRPNDVVGSLGSDADFDGTYLTNSLYVNAQYAIDGIESGKQRELSPGYRYTPDMTPGNFNGTAYDGVMREIVFNHVALVEDGRTGPDVVVGDEALKENHMKTTRFAALLLASTAAHVAPLLAMDQKITLPRDAFAKATPKSFKEVRPVILAAVKTGLEGKLRKGLALDATMEGLAKVIDSFGGELEGEIEDKELDDLTQVEAVAAEPPPTAPEKTVYDAEPLKAHLKACGMDDAMIAKALDMLPANGLAGDEEDDEAKKKKDEEDKQAMDKRLEGMVTKVAMDEAIKVAVGNVTKSQQGIREALATVKPYVGEIPATMAFDNGAGVYRHALKMLNVDGAEKLHDDALLPVLKAQKQIGEKNRIQRDEPRLAQDASARDKALKIAPGLANIQSV